MKAVGIVMRGGSLKAEKLAYKIINRILKHVDEVTVFPKLAAPPEKVKSVNSLAGVKGEVIIIVGGDGTILRALLGLRDKNTPIMGVGIGRRNYLASVMENEVKPAVDELIRGRFKIRSLMRIEAKIGDVKTPPALNELYFTTKSPGKLLETRLSVVKGGLVREIWMEEVDGVIVSTPTGSSAYSLSAGGAIICEELSAMIVTPVCPQRYVPPIVLPVNYEVIVENVEPGSRCLLIVDGNLTYDISGEKKVIVRCSDKPAKFISFGEDALEKVVRAVKLRR